MDLLDYRESPSDEQKRYVAAVCPEYQSYLELATNGSSLENEITCDECIHWRNGRCGIFDEVLTSIDQT